MTLRASEKEINSVRHEGVPSKISWGNGGSILLGVKLYKPVLSILLARKLSFWADDFKTLTRILSHLVCRKQDP